MRPVKTILLVALCAGLGAGLGGALSGSAGAGVGGGAGTVLGFAVAELRVRGANPPLAANMALVLTGEGFELHLLGWLRPSPRRELFSAIYAGGAIGGL